MVWGTGIWGTDPWGTSSPSALPAPVLTAVTSEPGPTASLFDPAVVAERGGTIMRVFGSNFLAREEAPYVDIDILIGNAIDGYTVTAQGFVFDPEFDVTNSRIICGAPALVSGLYHVRVTTDNGTSAVLENAIESRLFAEEYKTVSARAKFAPVWKTGERYLRRG